MLIWALVAASAVVWGLRLLPRGPRVIPEPAIEQAPQARPSDVARMLGGDQPAAPTAPLASADNSRFQLLGVVAPIDLSTSDVGLALISIDGMPARAYRVGAQLARGNVLQRIQMRGVSIGPHDGPATLALNLPSLSVPVTVSADPISPANPVANPLPGIVSRQEPARSVAVHADRFSSGAPNLFLNNPADMVREAPMKGDEPAAP